MTKLVKYEAARRALAIAHRVDEAKAIRDKAIAMKVYARQANDLELIRLSTDIRLRAERRAGELLRAMATMGHRQQTGRPSENNSSSPGTIILPTLKTLGISKKQSHTWQRLAAIPEQQFEQVVGNAVAAMNDVIGRARSPVAPIRESHPTMYSVDAWNQLLPTVRATIIDQAQGTTQFNAQDNDSIDWARWSWNPVTGCLHNCAYCYARDIADRFYTQKFAPTFLPERLAAPRNTLVPEKAAREIGWRNVFVCSMADLFGKWVPEDWIEAVFRQVREHPEWNFLFLTKFPQRLAERDWPINAWCGTTVDTQDRVKIAEKAFHHVQAGVRWLSVEPMMERLTFSSLEIFNWIVIGGATASTQTAAFDPPLEWVTHLLNQADAAKIPHIYAKDNLRAVRGFPVAT